MSSPEEALRWQDEILQIMYWMWGEQLGQDVTPAQLYRFLQLEPTCIDTALQQLRALGLIQALADGADGPASFQLTTRGMVEGRRRFLDEFSSSLGKEHHLECGDSACDCHSPNWDGVCHTAERH